MAINPQRWLLAFSSADPRAINGDGRPWGDGTKMASRARSGEPPWDPGCAVTTYTGGYEAMCAIRDTLETVIAEANASSRPFGDRGHVYVAGWRLNSQRDLSDANAWGTGPWAGETVAERDQTALGLIMRLMQAGVRVRIMVWFPTRIAEPGTGPAHPAGCFHVALVVDRESDRLGREHHLSDPLGIVALDARVAQGTFAGSHHQKTIVVRGPSTHAAFCGGVDLGFTRRDAPAQAPADHAWPRFHDGDWQSGGIVIGLTDPPWPQQAGIDYTSVGVIAGPLPDAPSDLPHTAKLPGGDTERDVYGAARHMWHDQHLRLEGPIVATLEDQFAERWRDQAKVADLRHVNFRDGDVIFSSPEAFDDKRRIIPLPDAARLTAAGTSTVQMWRTIPWRDARPGPPFRRAEFTVMAGYAHAASAATELLWIFDQYFWSRAYARLLNARLREVPTLRIVVVLPPWADNGTPDQQGVAHRARKLALDTVIHGIEDADLRFAVYNLWDPRRPGGRGIYCHAKAHTYDASLYVCGSANINRRSLQCDSELACAVNDPAVVKDHQRRLWRLLFADLPDGEGRDWPDGLDLDEPSSGARFLGEFKRAAGDLRSFVRPDPWRHKQPALPNGLVRPIAPLWAPALQVKYRAFYYRVFDATSISTKPEATVYEYRDGRNIYRPPALDEISRRIELVEAGANGWPVTPWREQSGLGEELEAIEELPDE